MMLLALLAGCAGWRSDAQLIAADVAKPDLRYLGAVFGEGNQFCWLIGVRTSDGSAMRRRCEGSDEWNEEAVAGSLDVAPGGRPEGMGSFWLTFEPETRVLAVSSTEAFGLGDRVMLPWAPSRVEFFSRRSVILEANVDGEALTCIFGTGDADGMYFPDVFRAEDWCLPDVVGAFDRLHSTLVVTYDAPTATVELHELMPGGVRWIGAVNVEVPVTTCTLESHQSRYRRWLCQTDDAGLYRLEFPPNRPGDAEAGETEHASGSVRRLFPLRRVIDLMAREWVVTPTRLIPVQTGGRCAALRLRGAEPVALWGPLGSVCPSVVLWDNGSLWGLPRYPIRKAKPVVIVFDG